MNELKKSIESLEKLDLIKYETRTVRPEGIKETLDWINENICPLYCGLRPWLNWLKEIPAIGKYVELFMNLMDQICKCK